MEKTNIGAKPEQVVAPMLRISDDKLNVLLTCSAQFASGQNAWRLLLGKYENLGVKCQIDQTFLASTLSKFASLEQDIVDLPIAKGLPPEPPINEKAIWSRDYFSKSSYIDPLTKMVDYKRTISSGEVEKGDVLVTIKPGIPGRDGTDVFGNPICCPTPKKLDLKCGTNVIFDEKSGSFLAASTGRVQLVGNTIHVNDELKIREDVGPDTGNIRHKGVVYVNGNVQADYEISVTGDIYINGVLNAANVQCGGRLVAKGGINGNQKNTIAARSGVLTKYVDKATITSKESITVESEIIQSNVSSGAKIQCRGRIIGGVLNALQGIIAGEAGVTIGTRTTLIAGVYWELDKKLNELKLKTEENLKKTGELNQRIAQFSQLGKNLTPEQREQVMEMRFFVEEHENENEALSEQIEKIQEVLMGGKSATITVLKKAYPGVIFKIYNREYEVHEEIPGPFRVRIDREQDQLVIEHNNINLEHSAKRSYQKFHRVDLRSFRQYARLLGAAKKRKGGQFIQR